MTDEQKIIDEKQQIIADAKDIFLRNDAGARFLEHLSKHCHENENPYVKDCFDGTSFNCGVLSVIQYIRLLLESPDEPRQTETI